MITLEKQYRYRDGGPARILCVNSPGKYPVVSLTLGGRPVTHTRDGKFNSDPKGDDKDLIEVFPKWEGELWITSNGSIIPVNAYNGCGTSGWRKIKAIEVTEP